MPMPEAYIPGRRDIREQDPKNEALKVYQHGLNDIETNGSPLEVPLSQTLFSAGLLGVSTPNVLGQMLLLNTQWRQTHRGLVMSLVIEDVKASRQARQKGTKPDEQDDFPAPHDRNEPLDVKTLNERVTSADTFHNLLTATLKELEETSSAR